MREDDLTEFQQAVLEELVSIRGSLFTLESLTAMILAKLEGTNVTEILESVAPHRAEQEKYLRKRLFL